MARLIDTNVLVYRFDGRFPDKQRLATDLLRRGQHDDDLVVPHQAIVELVAVLSRPRQDLDGEPLVPFAEATIEAESLMRQFPVIYPDHAVVTTALRGAAAYRLSWFDAHLWAYAEVHGLAEILTEDFQHGRYYGSVRTVDPFHALGGEIAELPPMYDDPSR